MRTPAPRAPLGSPPAADTRNGVRQQMRAVRGAGAALPRCLGPRSADLKRAPSNFSKSGRDGRRGAAAQHTHYGAVHMDAGQPRAMRSSSAPPGACSARSRATHALSSRFSPRFSSRFSARQTRAIFPPKKISTRGGVGGADPGARGGRTRGTLKRRTGCPGSAPRCAARPIPPHPRRPPPRRSILIRLKRQAAIDRALYQQRLRDDLRDDRHDIQLRTPRGAAAANIDAPAQRAAG